MATRLIQASSGAEELLLYRLAKTEYANLSGIGSSVVPGRWNLPGQEALYTSTETGVPVLERLVHTPKDTIPKNLAMMQIALKGDWSAVGVSWASAFGMIDRKDGAMIRFYATLDEARSHLPGTLMPGEIGVAVPSVIVPVWNVILFPAAAGFWEHVSLETVEPFEFDPRLFPEPETVTPPV